MVFIQGIYIEAAIKVRVLNVEYRKILREINSQPFRATWVNDLDQSLNLMFAYYEKREVNPQILRLKHCHGITIGIFKKEPSHPKGGLGWEAMGSG